MRMVKKVDIHPPVVENQNAITFTRLVLTLDTAKDTAEEITAMYSVYGPR